MKKIVIVFELIVAVWLLCPLPEISILVGLIGGSSVHNYLNVPAWSSYVGSLIGALLGTLILRQLGWIKKMKNLAKDRFSGKEEQKKM